MVYGTIHHKVHVMTWIYRRGISKLLYVGHSELDYIISASSSKEHSLQNLEQSTDIWWERMENHTSILSYYSDIINITHHTRGTLAYIEGCTIFTDSFSSNFYHRAQYILYLFPSFSAIWNKENSNVVGSSGNININYSIILSSVNIYRIVTSILNISTLFLFLYVQK